MTTSNNFHKLGYFLTLLLTVAIIGCGGKKSDEDNDDSDNGGGGGATAAATKTVDMANGATISGTVKMDGTAPAAKTINMGGDAFCAKAHTAPVSDNHWVTGKDNGLSNAFVYVEDIQGDYAPPADAVTLTQSGCEYEPHVFGVMVGQTLKIKNSDQTLHNVHAHGNANAQFNEGQPAGTPDKEKKMDKAEIMVPIKCDVHGWMNSYAGVLKHPFFSVSDADGHYTIKGVPAGTYKVTAWHETTKEDGTGTKNTQSVTVAAKDNKTVDFTIKPE